MMRTRSARYACQIWPEAQRRTTTEPQSFFASWFPIGIGICDPTGVGISDPLRGGGAADRALRARVLTRVCRTCGARGFWLGTFSQPLQASSLCEAGLKA